MPQGQEQEGSHPGRDEPSKPGQRSEQQKALLLAHGLHLQLIWPESGGEFVVVSMHVRMDLI